MATPNLAIQECLWVYLLQPLSSITAIAGSPKHVVCSASSYSQLISLIPPGVRPTILQFISRLM